MQYIRFCFLILLVGMSGAIRAQDTIVLLSEKKIIAVVEQIRSQEILFKKYSNPQGPQYIIETSQVHYIRFSSGEREDFNKPYSKTAIPEPEVAAEQQAENIEHKAIETPNVEIEKPSDAVPIYYAGGGYVRLNGAMLTTKEVKNILRPHTDVFSLYEAGRNIKGIGNALEGVGYVFAGMFLYSLLQQNYTLMATSASVGAPFLGTGILLSIKGKHSIKKSIRMYHAYY